MRSLGRNPDAVASFDQAIQRQPRIAALYRGRELARLDREDLPTAELELALGDLEKSASLEPLRNRALDHILRGRSLLEPRSTCGRPGGGRRRADRQPRCDRGPVDPGGRLPPAGGL